MYYPFSEIKGADQLRGYREADLRLCFRICKKPVFSRRGSYYNFNHSFHCLQKSDELMAQKKLRTEVIQLEDALGQVRKAYEMLRIEFEQTLAAHEQTGRSHCGRIS